MTFIQWSEIVQRYMKGWSCTWAMAELRVLKALQSAASNTSLEIGYDPLARYHWFTP